ncbi:MAG: hypothetical protein JXM70_29125 [Pirellulales bacterium]|nr:hypothetical protein [Pirellulales bacterium]
MFMKLNDALISLSVILLCGASAGGTDTNATCTVPSPQKIMAGELPPPAPRVEYGFTLSEGGGFFTTVKGKKYPVESSYSYPNGGENILWAGEKSQNNPEAVWKVATKKIDDKNFTVTAAGKFYRIERRIALYDNHIVVKDTITNLGKEVLGIILSNQIATAKISPKLVLTPNNCTLFVAGTDHGLTLVALDDLYQIQHHKYHRDGMAAIATDKFGLDGGASYTIEWAVYPTMTGEYLEFVNNFRKVEGLSRTVEGAFALVGEDGKAGPDVRGKPVTAEIIDAKGVKYVSYFYLIAPPDDPGASLEGIEFTEYPLESALLKKSIAETHRQSPGVKVAFHIAHGLYFTNKPQQIFSDSRVIRADGKQIFYGSDSPSYYCRFISKKHFDDGYRWWIYYPTASNSFGKAMIDAIDYMLDEIGASSMYADGFFSGYAGVGGNADGYTHDIWDGYSVEIDPKTKTVKRKLGSVAYMALPILRQVVRKVAAKGGVVITNGRSGYRSMWKEHYFTTCETSSSDKRTIESLYIGPTVTPFGDPTRIKNREGLYGDVLDKLKLGALYFYFGDEDFAVKDKMIVRHMYPFTREETHAGWAKGRERIVTMKPGVYGWRGDKHLHRVYRSDSKGYLVANTDFSTVAPTGVRTELKLAERQSAVVEKIPVVLDTAGCMNVLVHKYDAAGLDLCINGRGKARLIIADGKLSIQPEKTYKVDAGKRFTLKADADGKLKVPLVLDGKMPVIISEKK